MIKVKFSNANGKLQKLEKKIQKKVISFTLPAGHSCPGAKECLSRANRETGKIQDGKETVFRCFEASLECIFPSLRELAWHNFSELRLCNGADEMADLLHTSLPEFFNVCRCHIGGDFFSQDYFDAWVLVARRNPDKIFYAYTKSLRFWVERRATIPTNLRLTASRGGKFDYLIAPNNLPTAEVVFSENEAEEKGLEIDHDDSHAYAGGQSFALLLHGTQAAGSPAAAALSKIKKASKGKA